MDEAAATRTSKVGLVLGCLGVLHIIVTCGGAGDILFDMLEMGWWRSADPLALVYPLQIAIFWSLIFGAMLVMLGWALHHASRGEVPGRAWAGGFGVMCLVGALAVPIGGFWIGLGLALWMGIREGRSGAA